MTVRLLQAAALQALAGVHAVMVHGACHLVQVGTHAGRSDEGSAASAQLQGDADGILKAAARQLREKSPKTRSGIFLALRELVLVLPGAVTAESMVQLLPAIVQALTVSLACVVT